MRFLRMLLKLFVEIGLTHRSDLNQGSDNFAILVSLFSGLGGHNSGELMFSRKSRYGCWYCAIGNANIQNKNMAM